MYRFDFTHDSPLTNEQLERVELWVNRIIAEGLPVNTQIMTFEVRPALLLPLMGVLTSSLQDAKKCNAMALFGDKYEKHEQLRVVSVGEHSIELCGGTHVSDSSQVMAMKIVSQQSVSGGVRRIEGTFLQNFLIYMVSNNETITAITGSAALEFYQDKWASLNSIADLLRTEDIESIAVKVKNLIDLNRKAEKEIASLRTRIMELSTPQPTPATITTTETREISISATVHIKQSAPYQFVLLLIFI